MKLASLAIWALGAESRAGARFSTALLPLLFPFWLRRRSGGFRLMQTAMAMGIACLLLPSAAAEDWQWDGGNLGYTRSLGVVSLGSGDSIWNRPIPELLGKALPYNVGIASDGAAVYVSVTYLERPSTSDAWGILETRRISDGSLLWRTEIQEYRFTGPVLLGKHLYLLTGGREQMGGSSSSPEQADGILEFDATNGDFVRRIDLPRGRGGIAGQGDSLYVSISEWKGGYDPAPIHIWGIDAHSGQEKWKQEWMGTGFSLVPLVTARALIFSNLGGGVTALDKEDGKLLWTTPALSQADPISDGIFIYNIHLPSLGRYSVQKLEPTLGAVVWTTELPWRIADPCQPLVSEGRFIAYTGEYGSTHTAAVDTSSGEVLWHYFHESKGISDCHAAASGRLLFFSDGWTVDLERGVLVREGSDFVRYPVLVNGVQIGFGLVPGEYDAEAPYNIGGLIALDAGIGQPELPKARLAGPSSIRMYDQVTFRDESAAGSVPIVARSWKVEDPDVRSSNLGRSTDQNLTYFAHHEVQRIRVTLTVMDANYRMNSTTQTYDVLPTPYTAPAPFPSAQLAVVLLALACLQRRRGEGIRMDAEP